MLQWVTMDGWSAAMKQARRSSMRTSRRLLTKPTARNCWSSFFAQEPITQFDERLWSSLVDFVTVYSEKDIRVTFKDGTEIQA